MRKFNRELEIRELADALQEKAKEDGISIIEAAEWAARITPMIQWRKMVSEAAILAKIKQNAS
jgi:TRAP-type C4-dicarboxylate transport system substrate-binding protein